MEHIDFSLSVGVAGAGKISDIYLANISRRFEGLRLAGIFDPAPGVAARKAGEYGCRTYETLKAMLADGGVDIVLNLTPPAAHYSVSRQALLAGKHVYSEKPMALSVQEGEELCAVAQSNGLLLGCAPDTLLGAGLATCKQAVQRGVIGRPLGVRAAMLCAGHERWHPSPEFYYQPGGGPLWDMGPYYLSAMVYLMGEVNTVSAQSRASFPARTVAQGPKQGKIFPVQVPSWVDMLLGFAGGAGGVFTASFDVQSDRQDHFYLYGSEGTLRVPDPNCYGGEALLYTSASGAWQPLPFVNTMVEDSRGAGLQQMAGAIAHGGGFIADATLAMHVLQIIEAAFESAEKGCLVNIKHGKMV